MKVVLLAAGRSFRMAPIKDKNFLEFLGQPLIAHQLCNLREAGFVEVCVVSGAHNLPRVRQLAKTYSQKKFSVEVCEQKNLDEGMAGGVRAAAEYIGQDPFLLLSVNDIVAPELFKKIKHEIKNNPKTSAVVAYEVTKYFPGGYLKLKKDGTLEKIIEKPTPGTEPSSVVNIVMHYHAEPKQLLAALEKMSVARHAKSDDYYEQSLQMLLDQHVPYRTVRYNGFWQPVKYPWQVLSLMNQYLEKIPKYFSKGRIGGKPAQVAKTAVMTGDIYVEEGVRILDHAIVQGPTYIGKNTVIGSHAFVRQSHIGANCVIGFGTEVARSYLGSEVWTHRNYIGDSVIGNNVSFGAGCVIGNLRLDEGEIALKISKKWAGKRREEQLPTGLNKLGLITGDNIRVGINTSFMPGVKIGSDSFVGAGIVVAEDVLEGSFVTGEWKLQVKKNRAKLQSRPPQS